MDVNTRTSDPTMHVFCILSVSGKEWRKLWIVGEYNPEEFTFLNGIFCNVKENLCRNDRYLGADGRRSGEINNNSTMILFGCIG